MSGLSSAIRLLETGFEVTIITRDLPAQTTSGAAAAVWYPYRCFPEEKALKWGKISLNRFYELTELPDTGVFITPFTEYLPEPSPDPWWKPAVRNFRRVAPDDLPPLYGDGYRFNVPLIDTALYLPWLLNRFRNLEGHIRQTELTSFEEAGSDASVIVNCSGLGARTLTDDSEIYPVRGQGLRVRATNDGSCYLDQHGKLSLCYVFPRTHDVILGGTAQEHDNNTSGDPSITKEILDKTSVIDPSLNISGVLETVVGLRPARYEVRLEPDPDPHRPVPIIHNYGHGGAGFTLSWGCAEDVVTLARSIVK